MRKVVINKYIVADPKIAHGKPTFKGSRVMVWQILEMLKNRKSEEKIFEAYPDLTKNHIKAALDYAASVTKEGYVIINTKFT